MYEIDEQQIKLWWQTFNPKNKLVEIRLLGKATYSGYFKDIDTLLTQIRPYLDHSNYQYYGALQAYYTINELDEALYSREQRDVFVKKPKCTSTDANVTRRVRVMLDFDPQRVASVSASNDEYEKAHLKAVEVYKYLISQGFKEPIVSTSGNGIHLYLPCDMPNDDEHYELVKRFLKSIGSIFSDADVELDETVSNASRIDKIIGTWSKKGSDSEERKWRLSKFLRIPQDISPNDDSLFKKIADLLPKEEPKPQQQKRRIGANEPFDLENWLGRYGIEYRKKMEGSSMKYEIKECPWHELHSTDNPYSSALFQDSDGKITYHCAHSHCKDKVWADFRQIYEPDAYNKPTYQPQQQVVYVQAQPRTERKKYEIKEEIPELGEKWMPLSSVKKVDITKLEKVKTGYTELDRRIGGLYMSEVTILSGSNASGKSSWLNSLILNVIQQDCNVALWSGELRDDILKTWIQMVAAGAQNLKQSQYDDGRYYVPDNVGQKIDAWLDGKLFLYNNKYGTDSEQVLNDMKILITAGVKVFVLDNMMSMNISGYDGDKNDRQKAFILDLKAFAMENNCHIILVAHPRKSVAFLRKTDISGSGDIINAVDNCWIMHRTNEDFIHAITDFYDSSMASRLKMYGNVLSVEKDRLFGVVDYMCGMFYDKASRRFKNTDYEEIHYGWEDYTPQMNIHFQDVERNSKYDDEEDVMFGGGESEKAPF